MKKGTDKPWEQQPRESGPAFEAFTIFRDLGPGRTFAAVSEKCGKSIGLIYRWKNEWNWQARASAWDANLDAAKIRKTRDSYAKKYSEVIDRQMGIALQLEKRALEELKKLEAGTFSPKDIKEYLKLGTELERINLELEQRQLTETASAEDKGGLAEDIIAAFDEDEDTDG